MTLGGMPRMRRSFSTNFLGALLLSSACDGGGGSGSDSSGVNVSDTDPAGPGDRGDTDTTTSSAGASSSSSSSSTPMGVDDDAAEETAEPDPPINFDLGEAPDVGELDEGCNAVDFLFVIDNSGSMSGAQTNLVANFPAFINGIQDTLADVESYHVGITTTDAYTDNIVGCNQLGSLVVQTGGSSSSNAMCGPYAEGFNFITEEDDLGTTFGCAARVGTSGSATELTMNAMERAIDGSLAGPTGCNEGFVRSAALLVVVLITDEADGPGDGEGPPPSSSTGTPETWYQTVIDAKDGIPENAATLVLTNYAGGACPPFGTTDNGQNLVDFAGLFGENGFVGGICEPDYGPIFTEATAVIEQACENFLPPG